MFFFDCHHAVISGPILEGQKSCKCGSKHYKVISKLSYMCLESLSLFPYRISYFRQCIHCRRSIGINKYSQTDLPSFSKGAIATKFSGWLAFLVVCLAVIVLKRSINPDDSLYRHAPKVGDIYFVDYYHLSKKPNYFRHPYTMLKVLSYTQEIGLIKAKVMGWTHSHKRGVYKDYFSQKYKYASYFGEENLSIRVKELKNKNVIFSIRRPKFNVDLEKHQQTITFEKKTFSYPSNLY